MNAQITMVLQDVKTLPAHAAHVEVNDKLIHDALQQRQVPAAAADLLNFFIA